ncbi:MAG: tetratricopeptide repeat protein, partial [Planctomycetaceae bacterium]|nr:tetratricopeptide repeat protein [Planctomycetaceae bacterium]
KTGRREEAERDVEAARKSGLGLADSFYNEAVRAITLGDAPEAERMIGFTLDLDPGHSRAHVALARLYMERRLFEEAAKELDRAIPVHPTEAELYYNRGTALLAAGRAEAALTDFEKALDLAPKEAAYLAARGLAKYRAGRDAASAGADFEAAITADPNCYSGWFNRGIVAHERKELEQAEKDLRRATAIRATPEGSIALGHVLHDRGDYDRAIDLYRQALEIYRGPESQRVLREELERTRRAKEAKP